MSKSEILSAFRFTAVSLLIAKALFFVVVYRRLDPSRPLGEQYPFFERRRAWFILCMAAMPAGLGAQQLFWLINEIAKARQATNVMNTMSDFDMVTAIGLAVFIMGVVGLFRGWLEGLFGGRWWGVAALIVSTLMLTGYYNAAGG